MPPPDMVGAVAAQAAGAPSPGDVLSAWNLHAGLSAALLGNAVAYVWAAVRVSRTGSAWPRIRTGAFLAGLAVLAASLESGIDAYSAELLSVHMVQHVLLTLVAAPLLLLGAPVTLALRALPRSARRPLAAAVTSRAARALAHPAVAWSGFAAVTVGTHFSPLYDAAVTSPGLHAVEHLLYIGSGLLLWLPVVGADPVPRSEQPAIRILYLLLAMPPMALVGVGLATASEVWYPSYLEPAQALGVSALADQQEAGMIMWLGGSLFLAAATVVIGWAALVREERRQAAREAYADADRVPVGDVPLSTVEGGPR